MTIPLEALATTDEVQSHLTPEQLKELFAEEDFWLFAEQQFKHESSSRLLSKTPTDLVEAREMREKMLDVLMKDPAEALISFMLRARHTLYTKRIVPSQARGEIFGTRSNATERLDDIYELRQDGEGTMYRYTALRKDYIFPRNFTVVVADDGQYRVYTEQFIDKGSGVEQDIYQAEGEEERKLLRQCFENGLKAAWAVEERSENAAECTAADNDALRRLHILLRSPDPYLYHLA